MTGGSRGIGQGIADALVTAGATVAIAGTDETRLEAAARDLRRSGRDVVAVVADVRDPSQADRLVQTVSARCGGIDILVNNAGIGIFAPVSTMTTEEWRSVIDTNLNGVFYCCRAVLPELRARGGGWIVNISSLASKNPFQDGAAYCASKAAINAFSEALMQEVRHDNIRVSYVLPGSVSTDFGGQARQKADWKLTSADVAAVVLDLLRHEARSLPSRVEIRPAHPPTR